MFEVIEQKIVERLKAKMPAEVHVATEQEVATIGGLRNKAPAVWVIYDGYSLGDKITTGVVQQVRLEWLVLVTTKSAKGSGSSQAARNEAGEIAQQVLSALLGFDTTGSGKYLHLADAPGPTYDPGYCRLPLAFFCSATLKGQA